MSKPLDDASLEELQAALKRKKAVLNRPPQPLPNPDFSKLIKLAVDNTARVVEEGRELKDIEHWCYERAIEAIYGPDYEKWRSRMTRGRGE